MPPKGFSIYAKNLFLTYLRCSLDKSEALSQLQNLSTTQTNKKYIRVCRELHENGEPHLHVLIQFERKFKCTSERFFDLKHPSRSLQFHPNIQSAESSSDVNTYIQKHGDYVDWGNFQIDGRSARGGQIDWGNFSTKEEALQKIKELHPRYYLLQFHNLNSKLDRIFAPPKETFVSKWDYNSFNVPEECHQWVKSFFKLISTAPPTVLKIRNDIDRPMSLIIEGPTRIGKTEWARSIGQHNYISGDLNFSAKFFSNNVDYNVIDNVAPNYLKLKHWKELIGAKREWQANCKYSKPVQIKGGVPSIILCNPGEGFSYKDFLEKPRNASLKEWTLKNAIFIFTNTSFY